MRAKYSDSSLWYLLPPEPQGDATLRRSNLIVIALLAFFTFGMLVAGFVDANSHAAETGKAPPTAVHTYQAAHHGGTYHGGPASEPEAHTN